MGDAFNMHPIQEIQLDLHTDVAEWCPITNYQDILVVGTYQLDESTQTRNGRLYTYKLQNQQDDTQQQSSLRGASSTDIIPPSSSSSSSSSSSLRLHHQSSLDLPGIFDLCWHPRSPLLAAALADGSVRLFQYQEQETVEQPSSFSTVASSLPPFPSSSSSSSPPSSSLILASCVDYSRTPSDNYLAASYSSGEVEIFQTTPTSFQSVSRWQAHGHLEAWAISTSPLHSDIYYSGGDDSCFHIWDLRIDNTTNTNMKPAWSDRKSHGAGVCCIAPHPTHHHILCTGSYDERVRIWDMRMGGAPVCLSECRGPGGVWRVKWHPNTSDDTSNSMVMLGACMQGGFVVAIVEEGKVKVVEEYPHQKSLAYGCDWCRREPVVATVSFYDRLLHLWQPESV